MEKVRPKKHLGQHFLRDENIAFKIVESLRPEKESLVMEIGPGMGVLTKYLLGKTGFEFVAMDIDGESIDFLKKQFEEHASHFLHQDFLKTDLSFYKKPLHLIGNFPYNISSQLFFKVWDHRDQVEEVVCMIQKEVADRICSGSGNKVYGILSVLLQAFYDISYLFSVSPGVFYPPPKVQSAVIRLTRNKVAQLSCDEALFKRVVKAGFGKRRKTLRNALKDLNLPLEVTKDPIFDKRAEQLTVPEFIELTLKVSS